MSKAILIMDMPETCAGCTLVRDHNTYFSCSCIFDSDIDGNIIHPIEFDDANKKRDDRCPLRPIPGYKKTIGSVTENDKLLMNCGWNACIDAMAGKESSKS